MSAQAFITSFINRKGGYVLFSSLYVKATAFLMTLGVIHLLTKDEFGFFVYANTIIAFIIPFQGFGITQGLLRYGAISTSQQQKKYYFNIILKRGILYSGSIILVLILLSPFLAENLERAQLYIVLLSFQLISSLLLEGIKVYTRLIHLNKVYSLITIYNNSFLLVGALAATFLFGGIGYAIALIAVPLLYSIFLIIRLQLLRFNKALKMSHSIRQFITYGFYMSLGGVLSQLLYAVDILLIGNLIQNAEAVAQYKTSNILPFSLLILPVAIMTTDFVKLAQDAKENPKKIKHYYFNYLKVISLVCVGIFVVFYFFSEHILHLFGKEYTQDDNLMFIFSLGVIGALLFRVPLGNMLSAIGWPKINALFSFVVLLINVGAGYYFVTHHGVLGAAWTTVFLMWFSGLLSLIAMIRFWRKPPSNQIIQ